LRHGINVAVRGQQRRNQESSSLQTLGIAHGRDGHVDARALGAERRQIGRHHHRGDVAGTNRLAADVDAEALKHRCQRLLREWNIVERVAGAVESDHETVADQLVLAHAFNIGEILDARGRPGVNRDTQGQYHRQARGPQSPRHHCSPM
jgi:hypothetical protein